MKKRSLAVLMAGVMAASMMTGVVSVYADADSKTLTVGFDAEYPPFGYKDDKGDYVGFDLDLAQEVCDNLGWELVKKPINWDSKDMELNSGSIDCIWNGFTINGREDDYTWSDPYLNNEQVMVVAADSGIEKLDDLAGKNVVVQAASAALDALNSDDNKDLTASFGSLTENPDYNTAFMNLDSGAADAIAVDIGVAKYQLSQREEGKYVILDEPIQSEEYGIGFKKGNDELKDTVWEEVLKLYRENIMDNETIIRWNFINIINNFFQKQYDGIQEDLFQIVTFANNNGDNFTKNILKTLLGKVLKDNDNVKQAIEIYNDQIAYFAKEKMAVGALLTWFLIADATLITDGAQSAMEIGEQALEVAQNPKIDSYFFTVLLKMVIAKCAITTSDFETAKIHLENAISLAKKFNMNDLLSRLYILYGKYFQELGLVKSAEQIEYLQNAEKMYKNAEELIAKTKNKYILKELRQSGKSLTTFCVMNNIKI